MLGFLVWKTKTGDSWEWCRTSRRAGSSVSTGDPCLSSLAAPTAHGHVSRDEGGGGKRYNKSVGGV